MNWDTLVPPLAEMQAGLHNTGIHTPQGIRYKEATSVVKSYYPSCYFVCFVERSYSPLKTIHELHELHESQEITRSSRA